MIEYRSLQRVAFLMMITLGLYFFFWFHGVSKELLAYNGRKGFPGLWVIGFGFVFTFPILVMIPIWKLAQQVSTASEGKYSTFFLVTTGIFIVPLIYLTQRLLNEIALEQQGQMAARGFDEPQASDEFPGDGHGDSEPPVGPGPGEPPDSPDPEPDGEPDAKHDASPDETPEQDPYVESEDIRTIGR